MDIQASVKAANESMAQMAEIAKRHEDDLPEISIVLNVLMGTIKTGNAENMARLSGLCKVFATQMLEELRARR